MTDIVMTTWKREWMTVLAIKALKANTKEPFRLILIDNGSDEFNQRRYLEASDVYVKLDKNLGLEAAKNIGMSFVESDLFISTDNDILVPKPTKDGCWLERLIKLYKENPEYRAISLRPQVLVGTGDIFGENPPEVLPFSHVPGYMRIMDSKLTRELGAWSDKRALRGHEEYWISERINKAGFKVGWASYIPCYHLFGYDDNWGYDYLKPEEHGHNPVQLPKDDWDVITKYFLDEHEI